MIDIPLHSQHEDINVSLPGDDLVHLEVAFNMLGKHRYGGEWGQKMAHRVRLGQRPKKMSKHDSMAQWALKALFQCVQNGWLPLYYFEGDQAVRRVAFFSNPDGLALHAVYPRPSDNLDLGGMVEMSGGDMFRCMVNVRGFSAVLNEKFGRQSTRRGPKRGFAKIDAALAEFFVENPTSTPNSEVIAALKGFSNEDWPQSTTIHNRINEARDFANEAVRSLKTPDKTPDGER